MTTVYLANLGAYNRGHLVGEHIRLPLPAEELKEKIEDILNGKEAVASRDFIGQADEECAIHDYESDLNLKINDYTNIWMLNNHLEEFDHLSDDLQTIVKAVLDAGLSNNLISAIIEIDEYILYSDVHSDRDLGYLYIEDDTLPEHLTNYFDYERYGQDIRINELGEFTDYGYVRKIQ